MIPISKYYLCPINIFFVMCKKHLRYISITILFILLNNKVQTSFAQEINYQFYENISLGSGANFVSCFIQDPQHMIWIGSNKGLYSYDGYSAYPHFQYGAISNTRIYCGIVVDSTSMYLGADRGLLLYNYKHDTYQLVGKNFPTDIRTMVRKGNRLWIGSLNGLYCYRSDLKTLTNYKIKDNPGLSNNTIYSIICAKNGKNYIGTYNGFCSYDPATKHFRNIPLPRNSQKNNVFVNSLLEDESRHCIWIGTEGNLYSYNPTSGEIKQIKRFHDNSIKSLALDANNQLLIGTDNGLYIYNNKDNHDIHIIHDSRADYSLINNIIWSIFKDKDNNIWLGTDYGISLNSHHWRARYIPISYFTKKGDGNHFYTIYKDSQHNLWLGGTNGLIRTAPSLEKASSSTAWFRMGDSKYPITHNRIRQIYEDNEHQLWLCTDGSIQQWDAKKKKFIRYSLTDSTHTFNANWAYNMFEDSQKRLWIATCLGGIFVVNKQRMLHTPGICVADYDFNKSNGLTSSFINQIAPDKEGNVWVLLYGKGIQKINAKTFQIKTINISNAKDETNPNYLLIDKNGLVWIGLPGGLIYINPKDDVPHHISYDRFTHNEILCMCEIKNEIWMSTTDGILIIDKKRKCVLRSIGASKVFSSIYYDEQSNILYMGYADGVAKTSPEQFTEDNIQHHIILSSLYVNNERMMSQQGMNIRFARPLTFKYKENHLVFELSDLPYSQTEKSTFIYKLKGIDERWNKIADNTNHITLNNLKSGQYELLVSRLDMNKQPQQEILSIPFIIRPPWYYTWWAKSIYICLFLTLVFWIINFFRVRGLLRIERLEKEQIIQRSKQKMEFFTNISHDFKSPLSMIIAPVSEILAEIKSPNYKKQLEIVQQNAMKLNSMIHQLINFDRVENNDISSSLILSKIDFIELAGKIYKNFADGEFKKRQQHTTFISNCDTLYINVDVLKIESIIGNLLSNASKYTPDNGHIDFSVIRNNDTLEIKVTDSGIGIPEKDLPYVSQRFFQSSKTYGKKEGTGIGLYLVKAYTELHNGTMSISSIENKGTTAVVTIPINKELTYTSIAAETTNNSPVVLIVDDNRDVANYIVSILQQHSFHCLVAYNGKEGFDICHRSIPDLIITDMIMPEMNGLEMCRQIRKLIPTSTIPIIMLTAKNDVQTEIDSIRLNIDAFIAKPFDTQVLLLRVNQLIEKSKCVEKKERIKVITTVNEIKAESYDEKLLARVTKIIEDKVSDFDFNVNALCELTSINNKQLYRKLKQLTGQTPVDYIKSIRMKKASMLLKQKKFTVAEVMYMVGFSNHSYFSKCFHEQYGKTPKQYMDEDK